jgi:pilus assembly protein TadC
MILDSVLSYPEFTLASVALALAGLFHYAREEMKLPPWLTQPAVSVLASLPESYRAWLLKHQVWSGLRSNVSTRNLAAFKVYGTFSLSFLSLWLPLLLVVPLIVAGFLLADAVLLLLSLRRRMRIRRSLPQALDLMVLCVDAGLGLDATLKRIASQRSQISSELNEELAILGRDILLGMERERAYQELYNRTGVEELGSLGAALNQSGKLGLSIARILRNQSEFLCAKLSQKAEERAHRLPVLMAFPLWFFIMPALLVIVLAPSLITFFQTAGLGLLN